jgi:hypothetical protein
MALNLAKFDAWQSHLAAHPHKTFVFSMASYKRLAFNRLLLDRFISLLDLDLAVVPPSEDTKGIYGVSQKTY